MEEAYTQYENSQPRCEVGDYIVENDRYFSYLLWIVFLCLFPLSKIRSLSFVGLL